MTQMRVHPDAKAMIERRKAQGDGGMEALRVLKRRLSDVVYQALRADLAITADQRAARQRSKGQSPLQGVVRTMTNLVGQAGFEPATDGL